MRDLLWMEIDLNQIIENINVIQKATRKKVMPVIKSEAYNLGDSAINHLTNNLDLDYVAVVDFQEARKIFKLKKEVLVLNSLDYSEYQYINDSPYLVISINKLPDASHLEKLNLSRKLKVHLQVDTGMNRLGFKDLNEFKEAINRLKKIDNLEIEGIYTHFSSLKNATNQLEKFKEFDKVYNFKIVHLCATSTYNYIDYGNYVRVGLDVYGTNKVNQAIKVACFPIEIRSIKAGDTVGYDEEFIAKQDMKIAVLSIGYANGFRRSLQGYTVMANNKLYKTIGKVCMNHLFVEIDESITYDTEFIITSKLHPIDEMAKYLKTTQHEILCMFNINARKYLKD